MDITKTQPPLHDLVARRWSPRVFADRPVPEAALHSVLEAARWAPSCFNEQPWRLIVATRDNAEDYQRLLACLVPGNQGWAKSAPVLMITVAAMAFERNGKANRHAYHDVGLASAQLALQATGLGLAAHFMAGFDADAVRATFAVPEGFEPVAAVALGYAEERDALT
ncbi:MAG: nitroreductase family protein, partial [Alphaproteobacteria bacterium]|nr:nitroreductase family protein [Alphaproteobacteria bacterium]